MRKPACKAFESTPRLWGGAEADTESLLALHRFPPPPTWEAHPLGVFNIRARVSLLHALCLGCRSLTQAELAYQAGSHSRVC